VLAFIEIKVKKQGEMPLHSLGPIPSLNSTEVLSPIYSKEINICLAK